MSEHHLSRNDLLAVYTVGFSSGVMTALINAGCSAEMAAAASAVITPGVMEDPAVRETVWEAIEKRLAGAPDEPVRFLKVKLP